MPHTPPSSQEQNLSAHQLEELYVVDVVLKDGVFGRTERVIGPGGALYVRKYLRREDHNPIEWKSITDIAHPAFPEVVARYELPDYYVIVMEYVQGVTLQQFVEATGGLAEDAALAITRQTCDAVIQLHEHSPAPIIHRDIKPDNILVSSGKIKIIDFGTARYRKEDRSSDTRYVGTIGYAAPEQFGFGQTDERTDIYAIGMVLLFMLTGVVPTREERGSLAERHDLSASTVSLVTRCIQFDPSNRFSNVREIVRLIDEAEARPAPVVPAPSPVPPVEPSVSAPVVSSTPGKQPKIPSTLMKVYKWSATIFTALLVPFALIEPLFKRSGFGAYDDILYGLENYALVFFFIVPYYFVLVNPRRILDRIQVYAKHKALIITLVLVLGFLAAGSSLGLIQSAHSSAYNEWKVEQQQASQNK